LQTAPLEAQVMMLIMLIFMSDGLKAA